MNETREIHKTLTKSGSTVALLAKGLWAGSKKSQGKLFGADLNDYPLFVIRMDGVTIDQERIRRYNDVCLVPGDSSYAPPAFAEILFLDLLGSIITDKKFPLSALGLIHIRQTITQHRPIAAGETLDLECRLAELRATERGYEVDCSMTVASGDSVPWEGMATFLSRSPQVRSSKRKHFKAPSSEELTGISIDVPENTGRAYAKASGDYNPHHLYAWTARPLGYKQPIAHGMWTLAAALGTLADRLPQKGVIHVDASFKRPILMPTTILLRDRSQSESDSLCFDVIDPDSGAPHLLGEIVKQ